MSFIETFLYGSPLVHSGGAGRWIGAGIALELGEQVAGPGLRALVVDQVRHGQVVFATVQGEALDVVDTGFAEFQIDDQLVLAIGELVAPLIGRVQRTAAGARVRAIAADQTALRDVGQLAAIVEQLERYIRVVLTTWILWQRQLHDIAAHGIDSQV
jgi:hypothetical protein